MPIDTTKNPGPKRLLYLDYLRGYLVIVIIIDHLWHFPSVFALFTGQAKLWVTAAEGFVMISGFLIGYVRGYKGLKRPFIDITAALIKRAGILYVWMIIASLIYVWIELSNRVPNMPHSVISETGDWGRIAVSFIMTEAPHVWVHFLYLYTVFLLLSVIAVGLMRRKKSYVVIIMALALYLIGLLSEIEWMKWQLIFFVPSVVGFYFESIRKKWRGYNERRRGTITFLVLLAAATTLLISAICTFAPGISESAAALQLNSIFIIEDFFPPRIFLAFLWFGALIIIFQRLTPWLRRYTFGVLEYIGTHSLTMYITHGLILCLINLFSPGNESFWLNTLCAAGAVLGTYLLIRLPLLCRILPK